MHISHLVWLIIINIIIIEELEGLLYTTLLKFANNPNYSCTSPNNSMLSCINAFDIYGSTSLFGCRNSQMVFGASMVLCSLIYKWKCNSLMFPETFEEVLRLIGPALNTNTPSVGGRQPIEPKKQLFVALWFMSTPDSYRSVCVKFGIGKATAFRALRRVTYALHCLAPRIIKWPRDRANQVMEGFKQKSGFPNVIGAIDGCHIKIRKPKMDPMSYMNRKGYYSINLQAVCDYRRLFTNCFVGYPGAVHDARVFRNSPVAEFLDAPQETFPNNSHLIGDSAYSLHAHLMVPFRNTGHLTDRQKNFNYCLSATRVVIEHSFALLKGRFRILLDCLPLWDITKIPEFIIACCVLHNICTLKGDLIEYILVPGEQQDIIQPNHAVNVIGQEKRNYIMNDLIIRN